MRIAARGGALRPAVRLFAVAALADAEDKHAFNGPWDCIYDIADADRVWIATF